MPCVDVKISGTAVTDELIREIETKFTKVLQVTIAPQFPTNLGYPKDSELWKKGHAFTLNMMPGWTWVTVSDARWAVGGKQRSEDIVARVHILVLKEALTAENMQDIVSNIEVCAAEILGQFGKKVHLFVDCTEGEVDMTLPRELFSDYIGDASHKLLKVPDIVVYLRRSIGDF